MNQVQLNVITIGTQMAIDPGTTGLIRLIFIQDSSSTTGEGLAGLTNLSSGLVCYYKRDTDASPAAVTLAAGTLGTWSSGGFKEVDAVHMKGVYEFGVPNAALAAGAGQVAFQFRGATNLAPVVLGIDIATSSGTTADVNVVSIAGQSASAAGAVVFPAGTLAGTTNITAGTITTATNLTNLPAIPAGWLTAAGIAAGALVGKGDWSTLTAPDVWTSAGRTLTSGAGIVLAKGVGVTGLNDLDAAGIRAAVGLATANLDTQLDTLPTGPEAADALLGRNIAGGSSGGRTVAEALAFLRNKWEITGGTLIVYANNDSTTLWTASIATTAGNPVTAVDPS